MKTVIYILLALAVIAIIGLIVRANTTPKFYIDSFDKITQRGEFVFDGIKNTFGVGQGKSVSGRNGYVVTATYVNNGTGGKTEFKLYKSGIFIKDYSPVIF